jgi:hypothetical protein
MAMAKREKKIEDIEIISCHLVLSSGREEPYFRIVGKYKSESITIELSYAETEGMKNGEPTALAKKKILEVFNAQA